MYVAREQNFRFDLLSKLANLKMIGYNHAIIQETLISLIIEVYETKTLEVS